MVHTIVVCADLLSDSYTVSMKKLWWNYPLYLPFILVAVFAVAFMRQNYPCALTNLGYAAIGLVFLCAIPASYALLVNRTLRKHERPVMVTEPIDTTHEYLTDRQIADMKQQLRKDEAMMFDNAFLRGLRIARD
jgi:hypothetical protein